MSGVVLIDTHCHLNLPPLSQQLSLRIKEASDAGVARILLPAVDRAGWASMLTLASAYPSISLAFGLHPCFISQHREDDLDALSERLAQGGMVAVGEIGLDFYPPASEPEAQLELFKAQLKLAKQFQLPVLLHVRKAHDEVLKWLRRIPVERGGIVHAFSGSRQQAEQYQQLGFLLGVGGVISYPKATKLRRLFAELPLEWLVLETDAPDMPLCGEGAGSNHPANVARVMQLLAELRGVSPLEIARQTTLNAEKLFRF